MIHQKSTGFSTVELLVALFIGAAFIGVGYQLFGIIAQDGAAARQQAMASDLAYQILRQRSSAAPSTCQTPATTAISADNPGLPTPFSVTMITSCPFAPSGTTGGPVTNYQIKVSYANKEITHAVFASSSSNDN